MSPLAISISNLIVYLSIQKRTVAVTKSQDARVSGRVINCHLKHGSLHGGAQQITTRSHGQQLPQPRTLRTKADTARLRKAFGNFRNQLAHSHQEGHHGLFGGRAIDFSQRPGVLRFAVLRCTRLPVVVTSQTGFFLLRLFAVLLHQATQTLNTRAAYGR